MGDRASARSDEGAARGRLEDDRGMDETIAETERCRGGPMRKGGGSMKRRMRPRSPARLSCGQEG